MIIVNQDKDIIVNFDNVESINIVADLDGTGEIPYKIYAETSSGSIELGEYATEERAKEMLGEIAKTYQFYQGKEYTIGDYNSLWGDYEFGVYQMYERR